MVCARRWLAVALLCSWLLPHQATLTYDYGPQAQYAGEAKWLHLTHKYQILPQGGFYPESVRPPAMITLRWNDTIPRANSIGQPTDTGQLKETTIFFGPLLGVRYTAERPGGEMKELYVEKSLHNPEDESQLIQGAHFLEYYALVFEEEQFYDKAYCDKHPLPEAVSCKGHLRQEVEMGRFTETDQPCCKGDLEGVYTSFQEELEKVIRDFKLSGTSSAVEHNSKKLEVDMVQAFKTAIKSIKATTVDEREKKLFAAAKAFDEATEAILKPYELHREGKKLPTAISNDPWMLAKPYTRCDDRGDETYSCGPAGLGEWVLKTAFTKHHVPLRIGMFAWQLKNHMNVSHIISVCSELDVMFAVQPYEEPYAQNSGMCMKVGQEREIDLASIFKYESYNNMLDALGESILQPRIYPIDSDSVLGPYAVNQDFAKSPDNIYSATLHEYGLYHAWPACRDGGSFPVPEPQWTEEARTRNIPMLVQTLSRGDSIYVHDMSSAGRATMIVALLVMEATGGYWLDILKAVREAQPDAFSTAAEVLYLERYWRQYTARHMPVKDTLADWSNWDTGRHGKESEREVDKRYPDEMGPAHLSQEQRQGWPAVDADGRPGPAMVAPWRKRGENRNVKSKWNVTLHRELLREKMETENVLRLEPLRIKYSKPAQTLVGIAITVILCICAGSICIVMLMQFLLGGPLMPDVIGDARSSFNGTESISVLRDGGTPLIGKAKGAKKSMGGIELTSLNPQASFSSLE